MNKEVKEIILNTLKNKRERIQSGKGFNIENQKRSIREWEHELKVKRSKVQNFGGVGATVKFYEDTHIKLIADAKERLERYEKIVVECDKAIQYIEKNY